MNTVILIAGIVGLAVAGYGLVTLTIGAVRQRHFVEPILGLAVTAVVVYLLIAHGDQFLR